MLTHWSGPVAVGFSLAAASAYVASHNPHTEQIIPPCLLRSTTGILCPACGGTRAVYDLLHGDIAGALHMNAFAVLFLIPPAILGLAWWFASALGWRTPAWRVPDWLLWVYLGLFAAFWILRNLPPLAPYLGP